MEELLRLLTECCPMVDFRHEKKLWSSKVIDSMDVVNIMSAVEEKYNISIDYCMITHENFDSAEAIMSLIERLTQGEPG